MRTRADRAIQCTAVNTFKSIDFNLSFYFFIFQEELNMSFVHPHTHTYTKIVTSAIYLTDDILKIRWR